MKELKIEIPKGYEVDTERSTFEKIVFKKIEDKLPKTWEEFCEQNPIGIEFFITNCSGIVNTTTGSRNRFTDVNLLSTFKDAEAHLVLIQLHRLRDVYRQGWVPDWKNENQVKYTITCSSDKILIEYHITQQNFLSFQSLEIAQAFLKNFKDLIEKAKELI